MSETDDSGNTRRRTVESAVEKWIEQLVDLSGNNKLLFQKSSGQGSLTFGEVESQHLAMLLSGRKKSLSQLFGEASNEAASSARAIHKKTRIDIEERGVNTLMLGVGVLSWDERKSKAKPGAPIFLIPCVLEPKGSLGDDFDIQADPSEAIFNPSLSQYLRSIYKQDIAAELIAIDIDGVTGGLDQLRNLTQLASKTMPSLPGAMSTFEVALTNYAYTKLPMVEDLRASIDTLVDNDLTAAFADDPSAKRSLRARHGSVVAGSPGGEPTAGESLVLVADSSQQQAINRVLAGQSLVIEGPPGTGKSQTIANLIASLAYEGRSVLFVAEKRAAIDAVTDRLSELRLDSLCHDLHSKSQSKREIARKLADALEQLSQPLETNPSSLHDSRDRSVARLRSYTSSLSASLPIWDVSPYEVLSRLLSSDRPTSCVTALDSHSVQAITPNVLDELVDLLREFILRDGLVFAQAQSIDDPLSGTHPWFAFELDSEQQVEQATDLVSQLVEELPSIEEAICQLTDDAGLSLPRTASGWREAVDLLEGASELSMAYESDKLWSADLQVLTDALRPANRSAIGRLVAHVFQPSYRKAKQVALSMARDETRSLDERRGDLLRALELRGRWAESSLSGGPPCCPTGLVTTIEQLDRFVENLEKLEAIGGCKDSINVDIGHLIVWLTQLSSQQERARRVPVVRTLYRKLTSAGLRDLIQECTVDGDSADSGPERLRYAWLLAVWREALSEHSDLRQFDGRVHSKEVENFSQLDVEHFSTNRDLVARRVAARAVSILDENPEQRAVVRKEATKKTKHIGLRRLFDLAPDVLIALKPCWTMSPLLVSQLLPSNRQIFDVVIFDEASQVRPAEAMPALLRARQAVFAGDQQQLGPTSFFDGGRDEEQELEESTEATQGMESILATASASELLPRTMLLWHYRSKDDRLIAFSNARIYKNQLNTFPGCYQQPPVRFVHVDQDPATAALDSSAPAEVERVVQEIVRHAQDRPTVSLGVITPGMPHMRKIEERLIEVRRDRPDLDEFFESSSDTDRFFVKNLERVQGDERDRIILSLGYAKNRKGRLPLNFGPINKDGGERRLNVAVTRAKEEMTLVSSFTAEDIPENSASKAGVQFLRGYLDSAAKSDAEPIPTDATKLSPLEEDISRRLAAKGLPVSMKIGSGTYPIDLVALHPTERGRRILAIETDGPQYQALPTVRDRDRLRPEVLEAKGWIHHRIWSVDWFNNPDDVAANIVDAYDQAVRSVDDVAITPAVSGRVAATGLTDTQPGVRGRSSPAPVDTGRGPIDTYSDAELVELLIWIRSDGVLRLADDLFEAAFLQLGLQRRTEKVRMRIDAAIHQTKAL